MLGSDPAAVEGMRLSRTVLRRVWRFAAPYRGRSSGSCS